MRAIVVIPAYRPEESLVSVVRTLVSSPDLEVIVIDDGSGPEFRETFARVRELPGTTLLLHAVNLGKGAALKTGLNHVACSMPGRDASVTADADGQHLVEDIRAVATKSAEFSHALVLGARQFRGPVPLRSARYEFELDMLMLCKRRGLRIIEVPIQTVYLSGNRSSHFNPVLDSMRVYLVLFRFSLNSMMTALVDNLVFWLSFGRTGSLLSSQVAARIIAVSVNYAGVRKAVFHDRQRHTVVLPRYILLVLISGTVSHGLIRLIVLGTNAPVMLAKLVAETLLFFVNLAIQRDFIFRADRESVSEWHPSMRCLLAS